MDRQEALEIIRGAEDSGKISISNLRDVFKQLNSFELGSYESVQECFEDIDHDRPNPLSRALGMELLTQELVALATYLSK